MSGFLRPSGKKVAGKVIGCLGVGILDIMSNVGWVLVMEVIALREGVVRALGERGQIGYCNWGEFLLE